MALAGVIVGILAKWGIDETTGKRLRNREDRLRFIADKRKAYAEFLTACEEAANAREQYRDLTEENAHLDTLAKVSDEEVDRHNAKVDAVDHRWKAAFASINESLAVVDILGPRKVVEAASRFAAVSYRPHLLPRRLEAERSYIEAAREDLGSPKLGPTRRWKFEPFDDDPADLEIMEQTREPSGLIQTTGAIESPK